jgi:hypothetical protein
MNTSEQALAKKIADRIADIREFIGMGWTTDEAVAEVKKSSTLGPKAWEQIYAALRA